MTLTDCAPFLKEIDFEFFNKYKGLSKVDSVRSLTYVEPSLGRIDESGTGHEQGRPDVVFEDDLSNWRNSALPEIIQSKTITLEDFIDTDAVRPKKPSLWLQD